MNPNFLPSRQMHAYLSPRESEPVNVSSHSCRDKSAHESVRSVCSRRSRDKSPHESVRSNCVRSREKSPHQSLQTSCSHRNSAYDTNNHYNKNSKEHYENSYVSEVLNELECRICGLRNEDPHSICIECRRIRGCDVSWRCGDCDCSRRSKCVCTNEVNPQDYNPEDEKEDCEILTSVMSSERKFLPDIGRKSHKGNVTKQSNPHSNTPDHPYHMTAKKDDVAINKVVEQEIDCNEKRNLDNIPLSVSPLCSDRLKPARHKTSKSVLSILETGEVCFELLKKSSNGKKEKVIDVCRISSDGLRVSALFIFIAEVIIIYKYTLCI